MLDRQIAFACACGRPLFRRDLCSRCMRRQRLSRERFGGQRESILARDGRQCQGCGELEERKVLVHHRSHRRLITLCRRCHPPLLRQLWREQHPGLAEQRELAFGRAIASGEDAEVQASLFDAA
jgi:hypothetical protein